MKGCVIEMIEELESSYDGLEGRVEEVEGNLGKDKEDISMLQKPRQKEEHYLDSIMTKLKEIEKQIKAFKAFS